MKKIMKSIMTLILSTIMIITGIGNVSAATDTIQLGKATKTSDYIAGVSFYHKITDKNEDLYCLNRYKNAATNIKANLVKNSKYITGGLVHILKNGYPNKTITGNKEKDYYITQTAVWWYLDKTTGSSNLGEQFKNNGSDPYNLRGYVKNLMEEGYSHRNDSLDSSETKLVISTTDKKMSVSENYYISNDIKATTMKNLDSYTVTLENAPTGTKIIKNKVESSYLGAFTMKSNESFQVKVPVSSLKDTALSLKVKASGKGNTTYMAYEYQPEDSKMQNVALLEKIEKEVNSDLTLEIDSSKVTVVKIDSVTKQPIAGAKLVLKDSNGKVITNWTSTTNGHVIRNLGNGNYSIEETEAPSGYSINKKITEFTISDKQNNIKINIENAPRKSVVNIIKIDQETRNPLAGAVLSVKNSKGEEVARFTTTENPYIITDLEDGTYTVEEISAPAGYVRNTNKLSFTIDGDHLSHQITFINAKAVIVPDTFTLSSIMMTILGLSIIAGGIIFIRKNARA